MSHKLHCHLHAGELVRVRGHRWVVERVTAHADCNGVSLCGRDAGNRGLRRTLLHPFDRPRRLEPTRRMAIVEPRLWLRRLCSTQAEAASWMSITTATTARIDVYPHQLEPCLALLSGRACRFLLADEVGLGKTIQAGLMLAELARRGWVDRALILSPPGLVSQWCLELRLRFGLMATSVESRSARGRSSTNGPEAWAPAGIRVASIDLIKRLEVRRAVEQRLWDVLVVDEAHAATPGSDRGLAVRALAARSRYVVLLTATPHSGDTRAFDWLTGMGRLARVEHADPLLIFRRTRHDVGLPSRPPARVLRIRPTALERRMHQLLAGYAAEVWSRAGAADGSAARLATVVLTKRSLSSASSLARSARRRLEWLRPDAPVTRDAVDAAEQPVLPLGSAHDEVAGITDAPPHVALRAPGLLDAERERGWLVAIEEAARAASRVESKRGTLRKLVSRTAEPVVVFTEYRDTLLDLVEHLDDRAGVVALHGGLIPGDRSRAIEAFTSGDARVLVTTDVAGEGLNLHARCRRVVNYELPWNPMRLEQRAGRVDRLGQARRVHVVHLVARETPEGEVLARLARRLERVRTTIGRVDHLLGALTPDVVERAVIESRDPLTFLSPRDRRGSDGAATRHASRGSAIARDADLADDARRQAAHIEARRRPRAGGAGTARLARPWLASLPARGVRPGWVVVYRASTLDGAGNALCDMCTAWWARGGAHRRGSAAHDPAVRLLASLEDRVRSAARAAARRPLPEAVAGHREFIARARSRERAIARSLRALGRVQVQPGLFDRRAVRQAAVERSLLATLRAAGRDRAHRLELAGRRVTCGACELVLVGRAR